MAAIPPIQASAPSSWEDSQTAIWITRALLVVGVALAIIGAFTINNSLFNSAIYLSVGGVISVAGLILYIRRSCHSIIDREKALHDIQDHSLSAIKDPKIYYFPEENVFSLEKGDGPKNRRLTCYRLDDESYHIKSDKKVGEGYAKTVFLGDDPQEGLPSTVRTIEENPPQNDEITIYQLLRDCPFVVHCLSIVKNNSEKRSLILDYCANGEFKTCYQRYDENQQLRIIRDALYGLNALHEIGYLHLDCHMANILVAQDGQGKLADFGSSRALALLSNQELFKSFMPTLVDGKLKLTLPIVYSFLAPEIVKNIGLYRQERALSTISGKADVWMFGAALACRLKREGLPYQALVKIQKELQPKGKKFSPFQLSAEKAITYQQKLIDSYPSIPENSNCLEVLLWRMLHPNPELRCSPLDIA